MGAAPTRTPMGFIREYCQKPVGWNPLSHLASRYSPARLICGLANAWVGNLPLKFSSIKSCTWLDNSNSSKDTPAMRTKASGQEKSHLSPLSSSLSLHFSGFLLPGTKSHDQYIIAKMETQPRLDANKYHICLSPGKSKRPHLQIRPSGMKSCLLHFPASFFFLRPARRKAPEPYPLTRSQHPLGTARK